MKVFKVFTAPWCDHCTNVIRDLPDLEEEFGIEFEMINAEDNFEVAKAYEVRSVPAFVVEEDCRVVGRFTANDAFNMNALRGFLERVCNVGN